MKSRHSVSGRASVPWAVFLGCTTARRLARERRITKCQAAQLLCRSFALGAISRTGRGVYASEMPK